MISDISEFCEDARTVTRDQHGVRVTYTDGRVRYHIRGTEESARTYIGILEGVVTREDWGVEKIELVKRAITVTIRDWEEGA